MAALAELLDVERTRLTGVNLDPPKQEPSEGWVADLIEGLVLELITGNLDLVVDEFNDPPYPPFPDWRQQVLNDHLGSWADQQENG